MGEQTLRQKAAEIKNRLNYFLTARIKGGDYPKPTIQGLQIKTSGAFTKAAIELNPAHTATQAAAVRQIIKRYIVNNGPQMILDFDPNGPPKTGNQHDAVQLG